MTTQKFASIAAVGLAVVLGGTFLITQMLAPARDLNACTRGTVAGGAIGGPFTLIDQTGATVTDAQVLAQPSLIYFGYTFCPDVCPFDVARNVVAVDILAAQGVDVTPVFITIDPQRDTVEELAAYAEDHHPDMIALTGTEAQTQAAAKAYRVYAQQQPSDHEDFYIVDHSTFSYLTLPGHGFVEFFRNDLSPEQMAERIACFVFAA